MHNDSRTVPFPVTSFPVIPTRWDCARFGAECVRSGDDKKSPLGMMAAGAELVHL